MTVLFMSRKERDANRHIYSVCIVSMYTRKHVYTSRDFKVV